MRVTETETESEFKKVEQTTTIEKIRCDVCGHDYAEDEWDGNEFVVNPGVERTAHSIAELEDLFNTYYKEIPRHVIEDGYDGTEMNFEVPQQLFIETLAEEMPFAKEFSEYSERAKLSSLQQKKRYADMLGTLNFYLTEDEVHHFKYEVSVEATTDDHKHVCNDCYEVIFDGP